MALVVLVYKIKFFLIFTTVYFFIFYLLLQITLPKELQSIPYIPGNALYTDRIYYDEIKHKSLSGLDLIPIPRHFYLPITIRASSNFVAYLAISMENDQPTRLSEWKETSIPFFAKGVSTNLTKIIQKKSIDQKITIPPFGPLASSPIFLKSLTPEKNPKWKIIAHQPLLTFDVKNWIQWQSHKKQISIFIVIYILTLFLCFLGFEKTRSIRKKKSALL